MGLLVQSYDFVLNLFGHKQAKDIFSPRYVFQTQKQNSNKEQKLRNRYPKSSLLSVSEMPIFLASWSLRQTESDLKKEKSLFPGVGIILITCLTLTGRSALWTWDHSCQSVPSILLSLCLVSIY